jgi:hypothetical protein
MSKPLHHESALLARRRFLAASGRYGLTAAVVAALGGTLWNGRALAQTAANEAAKQKAAKVTMLFATEYKIEDWAVYAVPQAQFKQNLQAASMGAIYVKLHPAGQLGVGAALAQKIQGGTVQGGAVSLSNFSPYAPSVDLINIPFWCGENQRFANLVTSRAWDKDITPKVIARGYKPIFYFTVDPRTMPLAAAAGRCARPPAGHEGALPPSPLLLFYHSPARPDRRAGRTSQHSSRASRTASPRRSALTVFGFRTSSPTSWRCARSPTRRCSPPTRTGTTS